jgi:hypothetical protein
VRNLIPLNHVTRVGNSMGLAAAASLNSDAFCAQGVWYEAIIKNW